MSSQKEQLEAIKKLLREYRGAVFYAQSQADIATRPETVTEAEKIANGAETLATQAITALIQEARIEELKRVGCCDYWEDGCDLNVCNGEQLDRIKQLSGGSNNE